MKIKFLLSVYILTIQSCTWLGLNNSKDTDPTITGWAFRWLHSSNYTPKHYDMLDPNPIFKNFATYCTKNQQYLFPDSILRINYTNYIFASAPQDSISCGWDHRIQGYAYNSISLNKSRFLGDSALFIKPFLHPISDSNLIVVDSANFKIIKKGVMVNAGPKGESIPWYMLADALDTLILFPELSSLVAKEY